MEKKKRKEIEENNRMEKIRHLFNKIRDNKGIFHAKMGSIKDRNSTDLREADSIPGLGRAPGGGHSNPLQCSCLENPMDRGAWWALVHTVAKSQTQLNLVCICVTSLFTDMAGNSPFLMI